MLFPAANVNILSINNEQKKRNQIQHANFPLHLIIGNNEAKKKRRKKPSTILKI